MKRLITIITIALIMSVSNACTSSKVNTVRPEAKEPPKKPTICEVHGLPLGIVIVPIRYGFTIFSEGYIEALKDFPNAAIPIEGGCFLNTKREFGEKAACPKCTELWQRWEKLHGV